MRPNACWGQEELRISSSGPLGRFWRFRGRMASGRFKFRWLTESDGKSSKEMCGTAKRSGVFICMDLSKSHYILSSEQLGKTAGVPEPSFSKPIRENTHPTQYFWWFLMSLTSLQGLESFQRVLERQELWQYDYFWFQGRRFLLLLLLSNIIYSKA